MSEGNKETKPTPEADTFKAPAAFQAFKDLWGFHKAVHEDDWNDSQHLVVKVKNGAKGAVSNIFMIKILLCINIELCHYIEIWTCSY